MSQPSPTTPRAGSEAPAGAAPPSPAAGGTLRTKLLWVAALYFSSGFPYGLVNELLPVYLRSEGVALSRISDVLGLASWAWSLKFFWAPLVDRRGTRKAWIIGCQLLLGASAFALSLHRGTAVTAAVTLIFVALATLSATQDIALDAYSIELLDERERGPANGTRVTAYRIALIATSGALVSASGYVGWPPVFVTAGAVMLLLAALTSFMPATRRDASRPVESLWEPAWALLRRPHAVGMLAFVFLFRLGDFALTAMIKPFWVDRHFSLQEIGQIQGTVGIVMSVVGAVVGGALVPRFGTFRALVVLGVAQALGSLTYWAVALAGAPRPAMWSASVVEHFTYGLATAAFLTYLMSVCERRYAATQFAVLTALFGAARSIGLWFAGHAVEAMGYPNFFLLTFFLAIPAWLLLPVVRRTVEERA